jgi:transposase
VTATDDSEHTLSPKHIAVLVCLVGGSSVEQAAAQTGVGERTIRRWLAEHDAFKCELRTRQRQAMEGTTRELQTAASTAVQTLKAVMIDGSAPHSARVSAAKATLDTAYRAFEASELAERIEELESALAGAQKPARSERGS